MLMAKQNPCRVLADLTKLTPPARCAGVSNDDKILQLSHTWSWTGPLISLPSNLFGVQHCFSFVLKSFWSGWQLDHLLPACWVGFGTPSSDVSACNHSLRMAFGASWQRYCLGSAKKLTVKSCATTAEVFTHHSRSDPLFPVVIYLSARLTTNIFSKSEQIRICISVHRNMDVCVVLNSGSRLLSWLAVCVLHVKSVENTPTVREQAQVLWLCACWHSQGTSGEHMNIFVLISTPCFPDFFFLNACVLIIRDWAFPLFFSTVRLPPSISQS